MFPLKQTKTRGDFKYKMAGLKQPIYELMGQEFMPTNFNADVFKILTFNIKTH